MQPRPARPSDHAGIVELLEASGLPTADLATGHVRFLVADKDSRLRGVVGIEPFGQAGLLRSLAVRPDQQRSGLGSQLIAAAEAAARDAGMRQLVLLTQTAAPLFARHGYRAIERDTVPAAVAASAEFRSLCPASATCMSKRLEGNAT